MIGGRALLLVSRGDPRAGLVRVRRAGRSGRRWRRAVRQLDGREREQRKRKRRWEQQRKRHRTALPERAADARHGVRGPGTAGMRVLHEPGVPLLPLQRLQRVAEHGRGLLNVAGATPQNTNARAVRPGRPRSTSLYKPSSVSRPGRPGRGGNHSSRATVTRRLEQPTRRLERAALIAPAYMALLPMGFAVPFALPRARWALTPPFHPCRRDAGNAPAPVVSSLWHSPRRFRHRALPGIVLCGARTFLPPCQRHCRRSPERRRRGECAPWSPRAQRAD
jgi:hypothetical protein